MQPIITWNCAELGAVVGMTTYKGQLIVATQTGIFRLHDDDRLHPVEISSEPPEEGCMASLAED